VGELLHLAAPGLAAGGVTLVGLGRLDELGEETMRRATGAAVRALAPRCATIATTVAMANPSPASVRAVAEGALLGSYRYDDARSAPSPMAVTEIVLAVPTGQLDAAEAAAERATLHARAQCVARDLVTAPPDRLGPTELADVARRIVPGDVEVEVWDEQRLAEEGCGGLLAVGQGSARPPRLVRLRWSPAEPIAHVALVGKGITFDTGGISLKRPWTAMATMKADMAGAAAILAVFTVLAELEVPVAVTAELCLAENMPSGDAQRPSDVITIRDGTTVEVLNTDAEGRLVLADGLALAAETHEVEAIVDVATLTGAVVSAIGPRATGVFSNDDDLLRQLLTAAESSGEAMWHLPLWEDLRDNLESDVADLDNLGEGDEAGATMAALFLREFVGATPWLHLDIAGPAFQTEAHYHHPKHGTGVPVRTLLRWLEEARD
jgi:leucyl aminopeptidase